MKSDKPLQPQPTKPIASYRYRYDFSMRANPAREISSSIFRAIFGLIFIVIIFFGGAIFIMRSVETTMLENMPFGGFIFFAANIILFIFIAKIGASIFKERRTIDFYPTFMTIGKVMIHYADIIDIDTREMEDGLVEIEYRVGRATERFTLKQSAFPTDARKDWKIQKNTYEKLEKTLDRIIKNTQRIHQQYADAGEQITNPLENMQPIPPNPNVEPG